MRLFNIINYINKATNYPGICYTDVDLYFDMAISELNTTLHTSIPLVSDMLKYFRQNLSKEISNKVVVNSSLVEEAIPSYANEEEALEETPVPLVYYNESLHMYGIHRNNAYVYSNIVYGVLPVEGIIKYYQTCKFTEYDDAIWVLAEFNEDNFDLREYLPDDWITLWLIPYVCFKYTCRDGGTATTFAEECNQGFQQLQETYDVPSTVVLATKADKLPYKQLVLENLENLNKVVPTIAIDESMKHPRAINATHGSMYDNGGFGV